MKHRSLSWACTALAASGLVLTSCGSGDGSDTGTSSADGPSVAAAFYPLAFVAERVAGAHASVVNLTQPGVESHDMELTARQVGTVADADLALYLAGFQPAVDEAIEQNSSGVPVDAASVVELQPDEHDNEGEEHDEGEGDDEGDEEGDGHEHDEDDEHGHDDEGDHEGDEHADGESDEHDHGDLEGDPHLWLNPANLATIAHAVADELAELDPDHADAYQANAEELAEELDQLDEEFADGLAQCERSLIVVSHEAFGYLTERYGLEQLGVAGLDPDSEPAPERVAEVHDAIAAEGVTTIFHEPLTSADIITSIAGDLGLETAILDPVEGLTDQTADEDYFSLMRRNLEALRTANGCA